MIWKLEQGEWKKATFPPARTVFIVCQGPSLAGMDTAILSGPGRLVIGVNNVYPRVRPDVWIGMDDSDCYEQRLFWEPFPKIMRGGNQKQAFAGATLGDVPAAFFVDVDKGDDMWRYQSDGKFSWHGDTLRIALQFALSIGCTEINLIGVDLSTAARDYADDTQLTEGQRAYNQALYDRQRAFLRLFAAQARWRGVRIASSSPNSCINDFLHFSPVAEVIASIEARMLSGRPKRHVLEFTSAA